MYRKQVFGVVHLIGRDLAQLAGIVTRRLAPVGLATRRPQNRLGLANFRHLDVDTRQAIESL